MRVIGSSAFGVQTDWRIGENGRLWTHAMTERESQVAGRIGRKFAVYTGDITITNSAESALFYFKNTGLNDINIETVVYNIGTSTGGSGDRILNVIRNPTEGDIIDNAVPMDIQGISTNQNYGSTNVPSILAYKGAQGNSFTEDDGIQTPTRFDGPSGRSAVPLDDVVLPSNTAMGFNFTPASGNTSQIVQFGLVFYERNNEISGITKI